MNTAIIHPMLVHFPIALIITGFLFATISLFCKKCRKNCDSKRSNMMLVTTFMILSLGAISALVAILSGFVFTNSMVGMMEMMRQSHLCYALIATILSIIASVLYGIHIYTSKNCQLVAYIIYVAAVVMISVTGHLGGQMVFGV